MTNVETDAGGRAERGVGGMTDETRSLSDVRIDDQGSGRYRNTPLACPRNREGYSGFGTAQRRPNSRAFLDAYVVRQEPVL